MTRRTPRRRQRGQVLILLFLGTLLVGGSAASLGTVFSDARIKQIRASLKALVSEEPRRKSLDGTLDRLHAESRQAASIHGDQSKKLLELMQRHDAEPADFDALLAKADALTLESRRRLLDLRFELRQQLSSGEWQALFRQPGAGN